MKKALLIAEKPALAQSIKEAYLLMNDKPFSITFAAARGHLIGMDDPDKYCAEWGYPWTLEVLPMIPKPGQFKKSVKSDCRKIYSNIVKELNSGEYDYVISAGDPGREGELIIDEILTLAKCKLPQLRYWCQDQSVASSQAALKNLLPPQMNLKKAAMLREWYDWLLGMNGSRAASLSTGLKLSVGRVMTAVQNMVVIRDYEHENFIPVPYYECEFEIDSDNGSFKGYMLKNHNDIKFDNENEIRDMLAKVDGNGTVVDVKKSLKETDAPLLHDLTELQKEGYRTYGYTPDKVLSIAQSLYEKKYISYPRTDSRYLSKNVAKDLSKNLAVVGKIPAYTPIVSGILNNISAITKICKGKNKYVNDAKLTDHHALIPTTEVPDFSSLSKDEINIYILIARRLIAIFMPKRVVEKTTIVCNFGDINTITTGNVLKDAGYTAVMPVNNKDVMLPPLHNGDGVSALGAEILSKKTTAPPYYNSDTLLTAMQLVGNKIEDKELSQALNESSGLGTSATRAEVIKKLIDKQYLSYKKIGKNNFIVSTDLGRHMIKIFQGMEIISPELSAKWEYDLKQVELGNIDANDYYFKMVDFITKITEQLSSLPKDDNFKVNTQKTSETDLLCPLCGEPIMKSDKYYYCSKRNSKEENGCKFIISTDFFGAKISVEDMRKLLAGKNIYKKFTWKSGKKSTAGLELKDNQYNLLFDDKKGSNKEK